MPIWFRMEAVFARNLILFARFWEIRLGRQNGSKMGKKKSGRDFAGNKNREKWKYYIGIKETVIRTDVIVCYK